MKLIPLKNVSEKRVNVTQVRDFCFEPGDVKNVHSTTVKHPAVSPLIPYPLRMVGDKVVVSKPINDEKVEPNAPAASTLNDSDPTESTTLISEETTTEVETPLVETTTEVETPLVETTTEVETPLVETTVDPIGAPDSEPIATSNEPKDEVNELSGDLRDLYVSAPGITEANVDAVLAKYEDVTSLSEASKSDLIGCGVSKNSAKKVLNWASTQK